MNNAPQSLEELDRMVKHGEPVRPPKGYWGYVPYHVVKAAKIKKKKRKAAQKAKRRNRK